MARANTLLAAFNRGECGQLALGRVDVDRLRLSAEEQVNWIPRVVGPMTLRPGLGHVGTLATATCRHLPFVFSINDVALIEATPGQMRVRVSDQIIARPAVTATVPDGAMAGTGAWTFTSKGGGAYSFGAGGLSLDGFSIGGSILAANTIAINQPNVEHALRIIVRSNAMAFRVGSADGLDDLISETTLSPGTHSLAFTPTGSNAYVQMEVSRSLTTVVGSVQIEAAGPMTIPAFWDAVSIPYIRAEQSGDVVFLATYANPPHRIERRAAHSWSLVRFDVEDGPFAAFPTKTAKLTFIAGVGSGQVTSDKPVFKAGHVGSLIRAFTPNYGYAYRVGGELAYTPAIRISGVGASRPFGFSIAGTFVGGWTLERSLDGPDSGFAPLVTNTVPASSVLSDGLDNSIAWYRLGFPFGGYTSGYATMTLGYTGGGRAGVARITEVQSPGLALYDVLSPMSGATPTDDWRLGEWSTVAGWPSAVTIFDGRLCLAGRDRLWTSVSDGYGSFAETLDGSKVGDSSAISRSIGYGPVAIINWLLALTRLLAGAEGSEISIRSNSFDAPITPTGGIAIRDTSTQGSARVAAIKCDTRGLFVQKSGERLYQLAYDVNSQDYNSNDLTRLHPQLNLRNPIVRLAIQRQPDTRIHCVRQDGTVAILTFEPTDEVTAWWRVETDGAVADVTVLPGRVEDAVYYTVTRQTTAGPVTALERFARLDECVGGDVNRLADGHVVYSGAATPTVSGLDHLEGREVVLWGDGRDLGVATVSSGSVALPESAANVVVGLGYEARFKSSKLAYAAQGGTALSQEKRVSGFGLIAEDLHPRGLEFGGDFETMDPLPAIEQEAEVDPDAIWTSYDNRMLEFPGEWGPDARMCLRARAPRPATVMAAVLTVTTSG